MGFASLNPPYELARLLAVSPAVDRPETPLHTNGRVEHIPNSEPPKVLIKSVNPEYQAYERIAEEVNVVGRVVWAARRL